MIGPSLLRLPRPSANTASQIAQPSIIAASQKGSSHNAFTIRLPAIHPQRTGQLSLWSSVRKPPTALVGFTALDQLLGRDARHVWSAIHKILYGAAERAIAGIQQFLGGMSPELALAGIPGANATPLNATPLDNIMLSTGTRDSSAKTAFDYQHALKENEIPQTFRHTNIVLTHFITRLDASTDPIEANAARQFKVSG